MQGLLWSLTKNWGGRILSLAVFTILAWFLDPQVFGIVAAASLIFMFIGMVAEFGFSDAIIQAPSLELEDINLPFIAAMAGSVTLAILVGFFAGAIERRFAVPGLRQIIVVMCGVAPLNLSLIHI